MSSSISPKGFDAGAEEISREGPLEFSKCRKAVQLLGVIFASDNDFDFAPDFIECRVPSTAFGQDV